MGILGSSSSHSKGNVGGTNPLGTTTFAPPVKQVGIGVLDRGDVPVFALILEFPPPLEGE
ncbi:ORF1181 [White spot syndrome virus]|uniref:ORF1181 n=1 Tax=White spot syndrome virus TaxID=342409 RepID=A0A2D3I787_9VIRU|nr:ORF1181 [White spot syndrome virus]